MVATDQRLVGRRTVEEGHACPGCLWHVNVEPERPFRMQEADRRIDHDVAGQEQLFSAGTDIDREVTWRVTGGPNVVTPGTTSAMALIRRSRGVANFRFACVTRGCCAGGNLSARSGALQKA